jgi:cell division transport system permease protein
MFQSFYRVIIFALQDIGRNLSLSFMTVFVLVLMVLSINTLFVVRALTTAATGAVKDQIDVTIYFNKGATDEQIEEVQEFIQSFPEVETLTYANRDETLAQFRAEHENNPDILSSLDALDENPLGATLIIKTRAPEDYQKIITSIQVPEYEHVVDAKTFGDTEQAIERIGMITTQIERFSLGLTGFFGLVAFLIILNTIRVAIYTQRVEISIKRLVGATSWFIRGPYIVTSIFFSMFSVAIAYAGMMLVSRFLDPFISVILGAPLFLTSYFLDNILMLAGMQFVVVLALTLLSSYLAMRRHLRV